MLVRAQQQDANAVWKRLLLQTIISGSTVEGFEHVTRAFREYRESVDPWMRAIREAHEDDLQRRVAKMAGTRMAVRATGKGGLHDFSGLPSMRK